MALAYTPRFVVVDTRDGYVFWRDASGQLFDRPRAFKYADARNAELNGDSSPRWFDRVFQVHGLTLDPGYGLY